MISLLICIPSMGNLSQIGNIPVKSIPAPFKSFNKHFVNIHTQVVEFQRQPEPRTHHLAAQFCAAGVPCTATDKLARAHWQKLVWNIPYNGLLDVTGWTISLTAGTKYWLVISTPATTPAFGLARYKSPIVVVKIFHLIRLRFQVGGFCE